MTCVTAILILVISHLPRIQLQLWRRQVLLVLGRRELDQVQVS